MFYIFLEILRKIKPRESAVAQTFCQDTLNFYKNKFVFKNKSAVLKIWKISKNRASGFPISLANELVQAITKMNDNMKKKIGQKCGH